MVSEITASTRIFILRTRVPVYKVINKREWKIISAVLE